MISPCTNPLLNQAGRAHAQKTGRRRHHSAAFQTSLQSRFHKRMVYHIHTVITDHRDTMRSVKRQSCSTTNGCVTAGNNCYFHLRSEMRLRLVALRGLYKYKSSPRLLKPFSLLIADRNINHQ